MPDLVRGAVVLFAERGDYTSKPRPGVVVQRSSTLEDAPSITLCGITTTLVPDQTTRVLVGPDATSGLSDVSQVMVDKIATVRRERVREVIGALRPDLMVQVDEALRRWLHL